MLEGKFEQEFSYHSSKPKVMLKGIFDRVDLTQRFTRIVDYKTGKDVLKPKKEFEEIFSDPELKATFQLYYYSYIYKEQNSSSKLQAGIYRMKSMSEGISYLDNGEEITALKLQEFENNLEDLIAEIMNTEKPFSQTDDETRCKYCPYKEICNR